MCRSRNTSQSDRTPRLFKKSSVSGLTPAKMTSTLLPPSKWPRSSLNTKSCSRAPADTSSPRTVSKSKTKYRVCLYETSSPAPSSWSSFPQCRSFMRSMCFTISTTLETLPKNMYPVSRITSTLRLPKCCSACISRTPRQSRLAANSPVVTIRAPGMRELRMRKSSIATNNPATTARPKFISSVKNTITVSNNSAHSSGSACGSAKMKFSINKPTPALSKIAA
mmetsp:Transcript_13976/g.34551  ORF Transcript_13976/g.34551 Transcript_13976/m.34551 type:complete len:223 (+) Transcript_13976:2867-3535(+)